MQATTNAQNIVAIAKWYGVAKMFPQTHPLTLEEISLYTSRYGATPDGPDSAPWSYQTDPTNVMPYSWVAPIVCKVDEYYDPRTGEVYKMGSDPANDLDPTSPAFVEPPQIP